MSQAVVKTGRRLPRRLPAALTGLVIVVWLLSACETMPALPPLSGAQPQCVVLLHGLGRGADSMETLAEELGEAGYRVVNLDYPSRSRSIEALALAVIPEGIHACREQGAKTIHFVTHSMGAILLRYYLSLPAQRQSLVELGRVVMLSPPNHGSEVVDHLRQYQAYFWLNGPAGMELGTGTDSLPAKLGAVDYPVGVITGNDIALWDYWFSLMIPGSDDGKVSVDSARLEGMQDFLVVPYSHTFIMMKLDVIRQVVYFLRSGVFYHQEAAD